MTPQEWNVAIRPDVHWQKASAIVEMEGRALLSALPEGAVLNTAQLVEALYPVNPHARGHEIETQETTRSRIYHALLKKGHGEILTDCRSIGEARKRYGKTQHPNVWHRPRPKAPVLCPHCGNDINVAA
jgi:hypothetical protein